jgi:hypothetical protein
VPRPPTPPPSQRRSPPPPSAPPPPSRHEVIRGTRMQSACIRHNQHVCLHTLRRRRSRARRPCRRPRRL